MNNSLNNNKLSNKDAHKSLTSLARSNGWDYIKQVMNDEILASAYHLAESPDMTAKEIDFRRGAIWAARQLLTMPEKLLLRLENDIMLDEARKLHDEKL